MKPNFITLVALFALASCSPVPMFEPLLPTLAPIPTISGIDTATVDPTITPVVSSVQDNTFRLQDMNTVLPEDIIQETSYFGGMGGADSCYLDNYSTPQLFNSAKDVEIMESVGFLICGVNENEKIKVSVESPNGGVTTFDIVSLTDIMNPKPYASFSYVPDYQDPLGSYKVRFDGNNWQLMGTMKVLAASGPKLYLDDNRLIFYKFMPTEKVRLFVYNEQKLLGWKAYQMDSNGELVLTTSESLNFVSLGDVSGQAIVHRKGGYTWDGVGDILCPGASKPMNLSGYQYSEVIADGLPAFDTQGNLLSLPKGTVLQTQSQPYCESSQWLRKFLVMDGTWQLINIRYDISAQPFLRPLAELPPTPTIDPASIPACPGPLPTRLQVGMNVQVTMSGKASQLALRAQPSMDAEKVHVIANGRKMVILEGPVCADGSYWWRINAPELGFEGWSREGDNEDYWIDPLP